MYALPVSIRDVTWDVLILGKLRLLLDVDPPPGETVRWPPFTKMPALDILLIGAKMPATVRLI